MAQCHPDGVELCRVLDVAAQPAHPSNVQLSAPVLAPHWAHIPLHELPDRLFELPAKEHKFYVVDTTICNESREDTRTLEKCDDLGILTRSRDAIEGALTLLRDKGWPDARPLACSPAPRSQGIERSIQQHFVPRLWDPCEFLQKKIADIETGVAQAHAASFSSRNSSLSVIESPCDDAGGHGYLALDLGCGCGRDTAFLAARGWTCIGIENRYKLMRQATSFGERFAKAASNGPNFGVVEGIMSTICDTGGLRCVRPGVVDLLVVVRFLLRPALPFLPSLVRPGGYLLYSHFVDGVQFVGRCTPATEKGFLRHDELLHLWGGDAAVTGASEWMILFHEETVLADSRPIVNFLMQRQV